MKHIVAVGVCYLDTILSVPHFPEEDSKLRATSSQVRRGGNCGNTLEVLQQLLHSQEANNGGNNSTSKTGAAHTQLHLLSPLPDASSPAAAQILGSFGSGGGGGSTVGSELCLHRAGMTLPASSYIIRSESTGSRTIVSQVPLAEMTKDEFAGAVAAFAAASNSDETAQDQSWWHFEVNKQDRNLCLALLSLLSRASSRRCFVYLPVILRPSHVPQADPLLSSGVRARASG